jgi:hypothetical protein
MNEADEYMLHVHYMNEDDDDEIMILNIYMLYVHYMSKMMKLMLNVCFMCITQSFVPRYHNAVIRILCC